MNPIQVAEPPASIADALPVLNSASDRLRRLEPILAGHLEAEGHELCRMVVEYILTCLRSHDPAISLAPVVDGPVAETEASARESVRDVVDFIAASSGSLQIPELGHHSSSTFVLFFVDVKTLCLLKF